MKISKRGQATIAMKATNLPTAMSLQSTRRNPHHSSQSPKSTSGQTNLDLPTEGKEIISDGDSTQFQFISTNGRSQTPTNNQT